MLLSVETLLLKGKGLEALALVIGCLAIGIGVLYLVSSVGAGILKALFALFGGHGALVFLLAVMWIGTIWSWVSDYRRDKKKRLRAETEELPQ